MAKTTKALLITLIVLVVAVIAIQLFVKHKVKLDSGQTGTSGVFGMRGLSEVPEYEVIEDSPVM